MMKRRGRRDRGRARRDYRSTPARSPRFPWRPRPARADACRRSHRRQSPRRGSSPRPCECRRSGSPATRDRKDRTPSIPSAAPPTARQNAGRRLIRQTRAIGRRHVTFGQAHRTFELARRDVDQHLVHGPFTEPVFRHRPFPTGKGLPLPSKLRSRGRAISTLPPWKPILPFVLPQRCAVRSLPRPWRGPHAVCASASIISPSASSPAARQSLSKLAEMLASASIFNSLAGIAVDVISLFMALLSSRGISTPSLQAQGEQRRFFYFNNDRDIPHNLSTAAVCGLRRPMAV